MEIEIIAAATRSIGLGHLARSTEIARELRSVGGWSAKLTCLTEGEQNAKLQDFSVHSKFLDFAALSGWKPRENTRTLVIDIPWDRIEREAERAVEKILREFDGFRVGVDIPESKSHLVDLSYIASFMEPVSAHEYHGLLAFGWDSFFIPHRAGVPPDIIHSDFLVLSGGSDSFRLGEWLPCELHRAGISVKTSWHVGRFANPPSTTDCADFQIDVFRGEQNISRLLGGATVGFAPYGVSVFELIAARIPTVTWLPEPGTLARELEALEEMEALVWARTREEVVGGVARLLQSSTNRQRLIDNCPIFAGEGLPTRLVKEIKSFFGRRAT